MENWLGEARTQKSGLVCDIGATLWVQRGNRQTGPCLSEDIFKISSGLGGCKYTF